MVKSLIFYLKTLLVFILITDCSQSNRPFVEEVDNLKIDTLAPFYHGVASGDPQKDKVIIWTRVTPENHENKISVYWELSKFSDFRKVFKNGTFLTDADRDYTVKVDVEGLESGTSYFYRFESYGKKSITGRTKTINSLSESLRFAIVSCSDYQRGYFNSFLFHSISISYRYTFII